ncbi:MAG TPA: hypothetical protein IAA58_10830 [Candidatus Gallacutalibacter stercoravium]|nr:hypothetical protein [Candidatus Gallacutalibacter stercoravium]
MQRLKTVLKKLFFLPPLLTVLIAVPSFIFVFVMLSIGEHSVLAYLAYLLSAYAMIITVTGIPGVIEAVRRGIAGLPVVKKVLDTSWGSRLLGDAIFRSELTLHGGLIVNLLYVGMNLFSGIRYRSTWFIALAIYYTLLSAMRAVLVRYVHRKPTEQDVASELLRYRACGVILLLMNQALVGIIVYMVTQNKGFSYPGLMIYAMAIYAFYVTIAAVINVVKYRKRGSPVLSAAKVISLTAALVSMLSLETAMLAQFGSDQPEFRRVMLAASGGGVCAIVLTMAIYMIARSTKLLKGIKQNISQ